MNCQIFYIGNKNIEYSLLFFSLFEIGYLLTYYDGNFFDLFLSLYFNIVRCIYILSSSCLLKILIKTILNFGLKLMSNV